MLTALSPTPSATLPAGNDPGFFAWHPRALELLSTPDHSLHEVAKLLNIPFTNLVQFVLSQEGLEAIADTQAASIIHARTAATASLPRVVKVLNRCLDRAIENDTAAAISRGTSPEDTAAEPASLIEARQERARRACHLLVRIANFTPKPFQRLLAPNLPPEGGGTAAAAVTEGASPSSRPSAPHAHHNGSHALTAHAAPAPQIPGPHAVRDQPAFNRRARDVAAIASASSSSSSSSSFLPSRSSPLPSAQSPVPHAPTDARCLMPTASLLTSAPP